MSSRARQTCSGCPWHRCGLASCQMEVGAEGKAAQAGETPAAPRDRGDREVPKQPPATRSQGLILKCRFPNPPGRLGQSPGICVCSFPTAQPVGSACLAASRGLASLRVSGPGHHLSAEAPSLCFWLLGHDPLLTLPGPCPAEGQPQANPEVLCPPLPPLPSHPVSTHPKAHSPHGICPPPLTSPDSAAVCPGPASQPPPWPPPGSSPIGRGRLPGKAVIFPAGDYRFGAEGV